MKNKSVSKILFLSWETSVYRFERIDARKGRINSRTKYLTYMILELLSVTDVYR